MSADAIARLREAESARRFEPPQRVMVHPDDLRALLDRAALLDEALDALEKSAALHLARGGCDPAFESCVVCAVLAKAGRR